MPRGIRARLDASFKIAAIQYGVISRDQALGTGMSPDSIKRLVAEGLWRRFLPRTYALWTPSAADQLWRHRLMAGVLWLGKGSSVSHRAAAVVLDLDGVPAAPLEFSTTRDRRPVAPGVVIHRVSRLTVEETSTRQGLRVTSGPRTLVDLASVVDATGLELAVESALRRGCATIAQIEAVLAARPRTLGGRGTLARFLERHPGPATESALETHVWILIRDSGLPLPVRQHEIRDTNGRVVARVDFAYPNARLVIEADGFGSHSGPQEFTRDRARQNRLVGLGWTVLRVTWEDVMRRRDTVASDIAGLIARAAG